MATIFENPGSNPFSTPIQALLASTNLSSALDETATHLVAAVTTSSDPARALWELWDAFFIAVVTSSTSHTLLLALLDTLAMQLPTQPSNVFRRSLCSYTQTDGKLHWQELPRFSAQWRDMHDILEARRDWDSVGDSRNGYYLRFCIFSAALLKATHGKSGVHPVWVFYACHDVLENNDPESQPNANRMSPEKVWELDIRVAATWVRDGSRALWEMDHEELRQHWAAALDDKTDLWPREDGLTRERWQVWEERLQALSTEGRLGEETRAVVTEAAKVVTGILEET